jgi:3-oxoacyl-[acyl-carrier protein] reductase/sorbitol-6-phosphate 2-dehydrogenase
MDVYHVFKNRFKDRTVVISGAARGIGRVCALRFAQEGARCLICDVNKEDLNHTAAMIEKHGGTSESYPFDITNSVQVKENMDALLEKHDMIHVLVHSVGIGYEANFLDIGKEEWLKCININLNGIVFMTQPIVKNMVKNRYGRIVSVSSQAGKFGRTLHTHYSASKFGLNGFTQALAMEVAPLGINVNSVCPSRIETRMIKSLIAERAKRFNKSYEQVKEEYIKDIPVRRLGLPEDVAALVMFLASDEASYITGQCISISGGR